MPWTPGNPSLNYDVCGAGPPIILLHEIGGSSMSWTRAAALLAGDFTVVRYDQRGAGLSERTIHDYGLSEQIDDLEQVVEALAPDTPISLATIAASATIAAGYALRYPERIAALIFCAPALGLPPEQHAATSARAEAAAQNGIRSMIDTAMERMYPPDLRHDDFDDYRAHFLAQDPLTYAQATKAFANANVAVEYITTPCLFLAGRHDIRSPDAVALQQSLIRGSQLKIIEGAGHVLPHQAPQEAAAAIDRFVTYARGDAD